MSSTDKLTQIDCDWFECVVCREGHPLKDEAGRYGKNEPICERCNHEIETNEYFIYHNSRSEGKNQDSPPMADTEFSWELPRFSRRDSITFPG
ncbi:hypothetical protein OAL55_03245 [Verrucomicrobiales bacterium]|nr:hypothetical protein [Verrucomicrobiales bacterium]